MELKEHKSALAALATLGVTAVAAGATAFVKLREKRRQQHEAEAREGAQQALTAEQRMVYNEAISQFLRLNDRIYELRRHRQQLQPLIKWLATGGNEPDVPTDDEELSLLKKDISRFLTTQLPFINASLCNLDDTPSTFADHVRGAVGGTFDATLDEEPTGVDVADGTPISFVLRLGYYFPDSTLTPYPVKSVVLA